MAARAEAAAKSKAAKDAEASRLAVLNEEMKAKIDGTGAATVDKLDSGTLEMRDAAKRESDKKKAEEARQLAAAEAQIADIKSHAKQAIDDSDPHK